MINRPREYRYETHPRECPLCQRKFIQSPSDCPYGMLLGCSPPPYGVTREQRRQHSVEERVRGIYERMGKHFEKEHSGMVLTATRSID